MREEIDLDETKSDVLDNIIKDEENKEVDFDEDFPIKRYCEKCDIVQEFRTKHCRDCEACVSKYDHHCFWLGGCVGELNHGSFWIFLFLMSIHLTIILYYCLTGLKYLPDFACFNMILWSYALFVIVFSILFVVINICILFLGYSTGISYSTDFIQLNYIRKF